MEKETAERTELVLMDGGLYAPDGLVPWDGLELPQTPELDQAFDRMEDFWAILVTDDFPKDKRDVLSKEYCELIYKIQPFILESFRLYRTEYSYAGAYIAPFTDNAYRAGWAGPPNDMMTCTYDKMCKLGIR